MIKVIRADKTDIDVRREISLIFADGFTQWLGYFSKDPNVIAKAFEHSFYLNKFYVAIIDDKVAGMIGLTDCHSQTLKLDKKELKKHFGFLKGTIAAIALKKEFEAPFIDPPKNTGSIEFVGVSSQFRKRGVASQMITYIIEHTEFETYLIKEVADTNLAAMNLYQKLGFQEVERKPMSTKQAKKIGIHAFVSFQYKKKSM